MLAFKAILTCQESMRRTLLHEVQTPRIKTSAICHCREPLISVGCRQYPLTKCLTCGLKNCLSEELFEVCVEMVRQNSLGRN